MKEIENAEKVRDPWRRAALIIGVLIVLLGAVMAFLLLTDGRNAKTSVIMGIEKTELNTTLPKTEELEIASEIRITTSTAVSDPIEEEIPVDESSTESHRYEVVKERQTWSEAYAACSKNGGYLATVTSQEEWDRIVSIAEASGKKVLWLGAKRNSGNGFEWMTDEAFSYTNWMDGEPNNEGGNEDYLVMFSVNGKWVWADVPNDLSPYYGEDKVGYICEYNE